MATTTKPDPKIPGSAQRTTPRPAPKTATSQPARNKPAATPASSSTPKKSASSAPSKKASTSSSKPKSSPSSAKTSPNAMSARSGAASGGSGPIHNIKVAIHTAPVDNSKPSSAGTFGGPPPQAQSLGPAGPMPAINHPTQNVPPTMTGGLPQPGGIQGPGLSTPKKPKPLPKGPPKEPAPTRETQSARRRQTNVLKERQKRETQGKIRNAPRDVDTGAGFFPALSPLL